VAVAWDAWEAVMLMISERGGADQTLWPV
jgi:hypothetical protein